MTMRTGLYGLIFPCLISLALAACSPPPKENTSDDPAAVAADAAEAGLPLPDPWYELEGRKLSVKLPYRADTWYMWGGDLEGLGPFTFKMLDVIPRGGPDGTDLAVFEYEASGPGTGRFSFGLTKVSEDGLNAPEQRRMGLAKATYDPVIEVK